MKATAQLTVPDEAMLTVTLQMTVADAKRLRGQIITENKPMYWAPPLDKLAEVLRDSIATAEASHAAVIDPAKKIGRE